MNENLCNVLPSSSKSLNAQEFQWMNVQRLEGAFGSMTVCQLIRLGLVS